VSELHTALLGTVIDVADSGAGEACHALEHALLDAGASGRVAVVRLKTHVYRVHAGANGDGRSFVLKRFDPWLGRRNERVARRWLPAMGLGDRCPRLLATAADPQGRWVWHVYEDLGDGAVDAASPDRAHVAAVVQLIAALHTRAAGHPLLPECRHYCGDLGAPFFAANVSDAIAMLEGLAPRPLRDRLLGRLYRLRDERPRRTQQLEKLGGPDTLLHGDLWTTNTFVTTTHAGVTARLIDWDHTAVGPATYDLSTFLYRFPRPERSWILEAYRRSVASAGWRLPTARDLNVLFQTAEYARYANRVIWPAAALLQEGAAWGWGQLAEVERWFDALEPALPD